MRKAIPTPHDRFFHHSMADLNIAKAFFQCHLPDNIKRLADFNSLQLCKESYIDKDLELAITDMLFSVKFGSSLGYFYLLIEHQSTPDKLMALRLLTYLLAILQTHQKNHGLPLPIIYPLVFYTGEHKWNGTTNFFALFGDHAELAKNVFCDPFQLVDVNATPSTQENQNAYVRLMELCFRCVCLRDLSPVLSNMLSLLREIECAGGVAYNVTALLYVLNNGRMRNKTAAFRQICAGLSTKTGAEIMTLEEIFIEQGKAKGRQEGRQEGKLATQLEIAQKLITEGIPLAKIAQLLGMSLQEVNKLSLALLEASH